MKRKEIMLVVAALCALLLLGGIAYALNSGDVITTAEFSKEITLENGAASPAVFACPVIVPADGVYRLKLNWTAAPGLLTGARLIGPDGTAAFAVTGECLRAESEDLRLKKGGYTLEFAALVSGEAYKAFFEANIAPLQVGASEGELLVYDAYGQPSDIRAYPFDSDGVWQNAYAYKLEESGAYEAGKMAGALIGAAIGILLLAAILLFTKKDKDVRAKFDERQQRARGKGYCLGFWTAFGYFIVMLLLDVLGIKVPAETGVVAFIGLVLSGFVFTAYCIWADAYFALNENRKSLCVWLLILGVLNIGLGVLNVLLGEAVVGGVLTYRAINLICGIFLAVLGGVLLARKLKADGEDERA